MVDERDKVTRQRDAALQENASLEGKLTDIRNERDSLNIKLAEAEEAEAAATRRAEQAESEKQRAARMADQAEEEKMIAAQRAAQAEEEKRIAAEKAAQAEAELARQEAVFSRLKDTFAQEQAANQIKIEMLKSGIKVNLANEILFSSGSSTLNAQGQEVLRRAAADLKETPYQILVAGFTDNVAISGRLQDKFPSNWELAGARAASVVRLLEEEGVPPEKLLVLSFGENSPVEPNDTPEGKAKNRRIEIMLRPEPVTLD